MRCSPARVVILLIIKPFNLVILAFEIRYKGSTNFIHCIKNIFFFSRNEKFIFFHQDETLS